MMDGISAVSPRCVCGEKACGAMTRNDLLANGWAAPPFDNGLIVVTEGRSNSPLSWPANPAIAATFNPATGLPTSGNIEIWGASQTIRTPYVYVYSAQVQHELPGNFLFTVGYQGSQSRKMLRIVGLDRVYPQLSPTILSILRL